jgi:ssDNA-binding Zn-finger/Zn-ribbon topoisomerase 1
MQCVVCGKKGEEKNSLGLPSCKKHLDLPTTIPRCPECESQMQLRQRKNGAFWGCPDFPRCFGSRNLPNPMEELDIL